MAMIGDALRQAFMPSHSLREDHKLQKPIILISVTLISLAVLISSGLSFSIVFPADNLRRPFCRDSRIQPLSVNFTAQTDGRGGGGDSDLLPGAFVLTDQETVDYYWMVLFVPSAMIFAASSVYLIAGIIVAYNAPMRHGCLKVVENNYCASRRGGLRCLSILNMAFTIVFGLLALFLGSTLLTLGSSCSVALFWCYEIATWGLAILHGGAAFFLRRKAATILDENNFAGRNIGLEMLAADPIEFTPDVEKRVNDGFKTWMGSSFLSSDEDDEPDDYIEVPTVSQANSSHQRV